MKELINIFFIIYIRDKVKKITTKNTLTNISSRERYYIEGCLIKTRPMNIIYYSIIYFSFLVFDNAFFLTCAGVTSDHLLQHGHLRAVLPGRHAGGHQSRGGGHAGRHEHHGRRVAQRRRQHIRGSGGSTVLYILLPRP